LEKFIKYQYRTIDSASGKNYCTCLGYIGRVSKNGISLSVHNSAFNSVYKEVKGIISNSLQVLKKLQMKV